ncbi:MAG: HEPN domain-containing protein [archaeon]
MNLEKLLSDNYIEEIGVDKELTKRALKIAERDLEAAKENWEGGQYDWTLAIAYNSMLQAGRSLMFSKGYRPAGAYRHVSVSLFVDTLEELHEFSTHFDRLRKKRHKAVYEQAEIVSEEEAQQAINWTTKFISKIKEIIGGDLNGTN